MSGTIIRKMETATSSTFASIEEAIEDIRQGKFVVVVDAADRENEGDLTIAAQFATPEAINFMATHGRGLICLCLTEERCEELALRPMTERNETPFGTAFTISIEAREGISTGISARDRSRTIQVAIDPSKGRGDIVEPGHVFQLRARAGGVLRRGGQTEAAVDLARLAGLNPAGVVCEILNPDGSMARRPQLQQIALQHGLTFVTVAQLVAYRLRTEQLVHRVAEARVPTPFGEFTIIGYRNDVDLAEHVALVYGDIAGQPNILVRMHSKCLTGDVFGSQRCDCGFQLHRAMELIAKEGKGAVVYLDQEGRGIGLLNKLRAYALQDSGADTVQANERLGFAPDLRNYGIGAQILRDLGLSSIRVMTNNPRKLVGLDGYGLEIVERVPLVADPNHENRTYLQVKRDKLGHLFTH